MFNRPLNRLWLLLPLTLYLALTCYQLGLPGLHYDEAREAGVNAMEVLTGAPLTVFRGVALTVAGQTLPLMVQDYIGALNVYLALPFLAVSGIGVPNLRILAVLIGASTLLLLERLLSEWQAWNISSGALKAHGEGQPSSNQLSASALAALCLLAVSPSFVFWSRQGVFVTNITQPLALAALYLGLRWLRHGHAPMLIGAAFLAGLALYAKLLALWIIAPALILAGGWWLTHPQQAPKLSLAMLLGAVVAFLLALSPLILFNWQSGGVASSLLGNLRTSYYGVDNSDLAANLWVRWRQIGQVLRGDHLLYLGASFVNWLAPWGLAGVALWGLGRGGWKTGAPLLLMLLAWLASLFTVSGLFVTHYALLQPFLFGCVGVALAQVKDTPGSKVGAWLRWSEAGIALLIVLWFSLDLVNSARYHHVLTQSGGLGDHSDASYHLAYDLRYNGLGAPIALDWGMDATVRFLSQGTVTPIEIFGYTSLQQPDAGFGQRLALFLSNPANVYLLRSEAHTVFAGRRQAFFEYARQHGLTPRQEKVFTQDNGDPLFELWRVEQAKQSP